MIREQTTLLNIENPAIEIQSNTIITFASMKTPYQDFIKNGVRLDPQNGGSPHGKNPRLRLYFSSLVSFFPFSFFLATHYTLLDKLLNEYSHISQEYLYKVHMNILG